MNIPAILLLEGVLFVVLFGGLSLLRREGLSIQFVVEGLVITLLAAGPAILIGYHVHPLAFLIVLYLVTLRARILVDLANSLARRKNFSVANTVYSLAERLWPDRTSKLILRINRATTRLQQGDLEGGISLLKEVLQESRNGFLGIRDEAAVHYNLGVAYQRKGLEAQAVAEFNAVLDTWPASIYARQAQLALEKARQRKS